MRQLAIGGAVLSIHQKGNGVDLVAERPTVGAADICLRWNGSVSEMLDLLEGKNVNILEGPVARMTADRQLGKVCKSPGVEVWLSYPRKTRTKGVPR
ncbi:hypothetical protein AB3X96_39465 [Paraburkholderia sp. BR13439]|uniref:hypothetical protein n=1 Tax=unclassified Paraburkholderia TaxID=2615204 RepID=UPI0034CE82D8